MSHWDFLGCQKWAVWWTSTQLMVHLYQMFDPSDGQILMLQSGLKLKKDSCTKQMLWQGIKDWSRIGNSVYPSNESTYDCLFRFSGSHWVYASSGLSNCSSHWETPWNWWPSEISGYLHVHCHYHSSLLILWQSNMVWWKFHGKSPIDDVPISGCPCAGFHKWRVPQNGWFTMETSYVNGFVEYPYGNPPCLSWISGTHDDTLDTPARPPGRRVLSPETEVQLLHAGFGRLAIVAGFIFTVQRCHSLERVWCSQRFKWRMGIFFTSTKNAGICWNVNSSWWVKTQTAQD